MHQRKESIVGIVIILYLIVYVVSTYNSTQYNNNKNAHKLFDETGI